MKYVLTCDGSVRRKKGSSLDSTCRHAPLWTLRPSVCGAGGALQRTQRGENACHSMGNRGLGLLCVSACASSCFRVSLHPTDCAWEGAAGVMNGEINPQTPDGGKHRWANLALQ